MKRQTNWFAAAIVCGIGAILPAKADVTFTTFDNFVTGSTYGSWAGATLVSGPTSFDVTVPAPGGFGGAYANIVPNVDATGNTNIELTVTVDVSGAAVAGAVLVLGDGDGSEYAYAWYGLTSGTHVLTRAVNGQNFISSPG